MRTGTSPLTLDIELRVEVSPGNALPPSSIANQVAALMRQMALIAVSSSSISAHGTESPADGLQLSWVVTRRPSSGTGRSTSSGLFGESEDRIPGPTVDDDDDDDDDLDDDEDTAVQIFLHQMDAHRFEEIHDYDVCRSCGQREDHPIHGLATTQATWMPGQPKPRNRLMQDYD